MLVTFIDGLLLEWLCRGGDLKGQNMMGFARNDDAAAANGGRTRRSQAARRR